MQRGNVHTELIYMRYKIRLYNCHAFKTRLQTWESIYSNKVI